MHGTNYMHHIIITVCLRDKRFLTFSRIFLNSVAVHSDKIKCMNSFVYLVRAERGEDQDQLSRQRDLTQVSGLTSLLKLLSREALYFCSYEHRNYFKVERKFKIVTPQNEKYLDSFFPWLHVRAIRSQNLSRTRPTCNKANSERWFYWFLLHFKLKTRQQQLRWYTTYRNTLVINLSTSFFRREI